VKGALIAGMAGAMLALSFGSCGESGTDSDGTFEREEFPFTFEYAGAYEESEDVSVDIEAGAEADAQAGIRIDDDAGLLVQSYQLNREVTYANLDAAKAEFDRLVSQIDRSASARKIEVAGHPALVYDSIGITTIDGGMSRITVFFDGDQEYLLNCQSTPETRDEVADACDLALETLEFQE
jgi:hypothetical protein